MFTIFIHYALLVAQITIGFCLVMPLLLLLTNCITAVIKKKSPVSEELFEEKDYAIIVPAYAETDSIEPLVQSLLQLNYTNYIIYIIVGKNNIASYTTTNKNLVFLRSPVDIKRRAYAYRYAIENFKRPHTHITIVENNTSADPEYLNELNVQFNKGYQAVQGVSVLQHVYTVADIIYATGNIYKQILTGRILFSLGSSAALTGIGAAFKTSLFKQCIIKTHATDDEFTKALEFEIVSRGYQIAFAKKAFVWNKKTVDADESRYKIKADITTWLKGAPDNKRLVNNGVFSFCYNKLLFGLVLMQPSVFVTLSLSLVCLLANAQTHPLLALAWFFIIMIFVLSFLVVAGYPNLFADSSRKMQQQRFSLSSTTSVFIPKTKRKYSIAS